MLRKQLQSKVSDHQDAFIGFDFTLLLTLVLHAIRELGLVIPLSDVAQMVINFNARENKRVFGINPRAVPGLGVQIDIFREQNLALIQSLAVEQVAKIQKLLEDPANVNLHSSELSKLLEKEFDIAKSRADLIAVDQVLKLNGRITQARQEAAGISRYIWTTSRDERVRPTHRVLDGQVFSWNAPPPEGHPGQPIRCRCTAFPILDELDLEVPDV